MPESYAVLHGRRHRIRVYTTLSSIHFNSLQPAATRTQQRCSTFTTKVRVGSMVRSETSTCLHSKLHVLLFLPLSPQICASYVLSSALFCSVGLSVTDSRRVNVSDNGSGVDKGVQSCCISPAKNSAHGQQTSTTLAEESHFSDLAGPQKSSGKRAARPRGVLSALNILEDAEGGLL